MAQNNETKSTADTLTVNKNLNVDKNLAVTGTITQNGSQVISGVTAAAGSNIGSVGTPSVTASTSNGKTTLTFDYLKGAKGDKGDTGTAGGTGPQGVGISTIKKTSTSGLVDTYTITKTDNSTATFTVTNGAKGDSGTNGTNGTNGVTPTIKASSGANIGSVGTPSVTASTSGTTTTFTFDYLKGAKGDKGDTGSVASVETTGSGNAVTSVTMDANKKVTATKGATFLTSHQTLPTSLKNPNAIKFKNASGTEVSYDGSAAKDLTGGVYYATTAGSAGSATKATQDANGSDIAGTYLPLSGGTMTGPLVTVAQKNTGAYGLNLVNSDIIGVNGIYMADPSNASDEGISWYRDGSNWDRLYSYEGTLYYLPNDPLAGVSATNGNTVWHSGNLPNAQYWPRGGDGPAYSTINTSYLGSVSTGPISGSWEHLIRSEHRNGTQYSGSDGASYIFEMSTALWPGSDIYWRVTSAGTSGWSSYRKLLDTGNVTYDSSTGTLTISL